MWSVTTWYFLFVSFSFRFWEACFSCYFWMASICIYFFTSYAENVYGNMVSFYLVGCYRGRGGGVCMCVWGGISVTIEYTGVKRRGPIQWTDTFSGHLKFEKMFFSQLVFFLCKKKMKILKLSNFLGTNFFFQNNFVRKKIISAKRFFPKKIYWKNILFPNLNFFFFEKNFKTKSVFFFKIQASAKLSPSKFGSPSMPPSNFSLFLAPMLIFKVSPWKFHLPVVPLNAPSQEKHHGICHIPFRGLTVRLRLRPRAKPRRDFAIFGNKFFSKDFVPTVNLSRKQWVNEMMSLPILGFWFPVLT